MIKAEIQMASLREASCNTDFNEKFYIESSDIY